MAPYGGLGNKTSALHPQTILETKGLKSVFSPAQEHRMVLLVLIADVKVQLANPGARQKLLPDRPGHLQNGGWRRTALLLLGGPKPMVKGLAGKAACCI